MSDHRGPTIRTMLDNLHSADSLAVRTETDQAIEAMVTTMAARLDEAERERVRLRAAAQAVGADMDDVDFYGDPQKWPLVLNIGREPLAALAAALEDRDAK